MRSNIQREKLQAAYKGQLEEDVEKKSITRIYSVHRSSLCKVAIHEEYLTGLSLGKDADTNEQNKKSAARKLLAQSMIDSGENQPRIECLPSRSKILFSSILKR